MLRLLLMVFVAVNIIFTFTDQMGTFDWIVLVFYSLLLLIMLGEYVKPKE